MFSTSTTSNTVSGCWFGLTAVCIYTCVQCGCETVYMRRILVSPQHKSTCFSKLFFTEQTSTYMYMQYSFKHLQKLAPILAFSHQFLYRAFPIITHHVVIMEKGYCR